MTKIYFRYALATGLLMLFGAHAAILLQKAHAIWIYPDLTQPNNNPVLNPAAGQQLIANARASHVTLMFLSVYSSTPNGNNRYIYDESKLASLIAAAHFAGIAVYAAYGDPSWPALGCFDSSGNPSFPTQRFQEIAAYNATHPTAVVHDPVTGGSYTFPGTFDGIILDVEPPAADPALLNFLQCSRNTVSQENLGISVAISAFWNNVVGSGGPAYQQILNMGFAHVVVMGYRNFAGTFGLADNGIVSLDQLVVAFANNFTTVLVGLETKDLGASDPTHVQSFSTLGQAALNYQAQLVYNQFGANGLDFAGFAIHNYADSYLGGTSNWPSTNPTFPTGVSVQPIQAGSAYVNLATTTIGVTFTSVANSNATVTVTPVNPAAQTPAPAGFQLTNLAFDITTTASFSGPVTVCFSVPSIDPATFATLHVLHYAGGVATDATITSGPNAPNPVNETICASVTSFSPFVLAKATFIAMPAFAERSFVVDEQHFNLAGDFTLPAGAQLQAGAEVTSTLGTIVLQIPAGKLRADGDSDHFAFEGEVNGVALHVTIARDQGQRFKYLIDGHKLDLSKQAEPMRVALQIGNYLGSTTVFAAVRK